MSITLMWALRLVRAVDLVSDAQSVRISGTAFVVCQAIHRAGRAVGGLVWGNGKTTIVSIQPNEMVFGALFFACPAAAPGADTTDAILIFASFSYRKIPSNEEAP